MGPRPVTRPRLLRRRSTPSQRVLSAWEPIASTGTQVNMQEPYLTCPRQTGRKLKLTHKVPPPQFAEIGANCGVSSPPLLARSRRPTLSAGAVRRRPRCTAGLLVVGELVHVEGVPAVVVVAGSPLVRLPTVLVLLARVLHKVIVPLSYPCD